MDDEDRARLVGGGDPYRDERHPSDTVAGRWRAKSEGAYERHFPNEEQWTPSVYQQHLAHLREQLEQENDQ